MVRARRGAAHASARAPGSPRRVARRRHLSHLGQRGSGLSLQRAANFALGVRGRRGRWARRPPGLPARAISRGARAVAHAKTNSALRQRRRSARRCARCRGLAHAGRVAVTLRSAVLAVCSLFALSACSADHLQAVELDAQTLSRQLLAHWPFDDGSGTVAHDDSGNARDGQLTGGTWLTDGQFAGALHVDDAEYVSVQRFPDVASGFTVSAWVRLTSYQQ